MAALADLVLLVAAALVFVLPGLAVSALLLRRTGAVAAEWVLPGAFAVSLAVTAAAVTLRLALHGPWWITPLALGLVMLAGCAQLARRGRARLAPSIQVHPLTWCAAGAAGVVGAMRQSRVEGDQLYHLSVVHKLAGIPRPGFDSLFFHHDGGANPQYLVPVWHEVEALASRMPVLDPLAVHAFAPVVLMPLLVLAAATLGRVALGGPGGGALAAWTSLLVPGVQSAYVTENVDRPGNVALWILLPLALAAALVAARVGVAPRVRRYLLVALATVTVTIALLHANYVAFLVLLVALLVVGSLVCRHARRPTLVVGATVLAAGMAAVGALLPWIVESSTVGGGGAAERRDLVFLNWGDQLVAGGADNGYHAVASAMLPIAGSLLALLALAALAKPGWRAGWMLLGWWAVVIPISQSDVAVPALFGLVNTSTLMRSGFAWPTWLAIAAAVAIVLPPALGAWRHAARWHRAGAAGLILLLAVGAAALQLLVLDSDDLRGVGTAAGWALAAGGLALLVRCRVAGRNPLRSPARDTLEVDGHITAHAVAALVLALPFMAPGIVDLGRASTRLSESPRAGNLAALPGRTSAALRELPPGSVVAADPETALMAAATAPLYVTATSKVGLGDTDDNRIDERRDAFDAASGGGDFVAYAAAEEADLIVIDATAEPALVARLADDPRLQPLRSASTRRYAVWALRG